MEIKQDLIKLHEQVENILSKPRDYEPTSDEIQLLEKAKSLNHPIFNRTFARNYDRKVTNRGFGAPNCTCHLYPPCNACVDFTNNEVLTNTR